MNSLIIIVTGLAFGCATFLALQLSAAICEKVVPFDDGPRPGNPPVNALIAGSFVIGMLLRSHNLTVPSLGASMLICAVLAASWYSDVRCGVVPDYFTLVPLVVVFAFQIWMKAPILMLFLSAVVPTIPFAFAAWKSKGLGMGWGDVKLVAFGGVLLGMNMAVLALASACVVAVGVTWIRGRRKEPIAFAPYLAAMIVAAFTLNAVAPAPGAG